MQHYLSVKDPCLVGAWRPQVYGWISLGSLRGAELVWGAIASLSPPDVHCHLVSRVAVIHLIIYASLRD